MPISWSLDRGCSQWNEQGRNPVGSFSSVSGYWSQEPLVIEIDEITSGSLKHREPPEIQGSGYVVKSLETALWAFHKSKTFEEGCLLTANLGDDDDTTGAV